MMAADLREKLWDLLPSKERLNAELIDRELVGEDVWFLFQKLLDSFYGLNNYEECRQLSQWLLDFSWEKLNTGHWKDVPLNWRYLYSFASLFKALSMMKISGITDFAPKANSIIDFELRHLRDQEVTRVCDMGLLMGAPILDNVLAKLASKLTAVEHESLKRQKDTSSPQKSLKKPKLSPPSMLPDKMIAESDCPSVQHFQEKHLKTRTPVVIHNAVDYWPAFSTRRWSLDYIKEMAGNRTVPVELGSKYTDDSWSQQLMTVSEFISSFICDLEGSSKKVGYLAQHQLFEQIPELRNDIATPTYCCLGECDDVEVNAWFGPAGTISPLHHDPKHNFLVQVIGEKYVRLYAEEHSARLYPHGGTLLSNTSEVDVENPDHDKFPDFRDAPFLECVLRSGDMLYIPPRCWHYVRSLSLSFSVSFWWE